MISEDDSRVGGHGGHRDDAPGGQRQKVRNEESASQTRAQAHSMGECKVA